MKLLVVTGETPDREAPAGIEALLASATDILVISPSLVSPLRWLTGDIDEARRVADERLSNVLGLLEGTEADVKGQRGEELLRTAFDSAIASFQPDHLIVVVPEGDSLWRRHHVLDYVVDHYRLPLTVVVA
jgi:hypothetical protein